MVQGIFAAERKARADAAAAANPRMSGHHVDVLKRLAVSDSLTREERHALTESAAFVSTTLALDDVQALSAPGGTWGPSRDAGIPAKLLREMGTADTSPSPADFVGTGELSVGEIEAARMHGKLRVVEGGYGFVPRDWLAHLREQVAKPSGTADTVPAPRAELRPVMVAVPVEAPKGAWSEPGEGD
jgi:hypothetical protein